MQQQAAGRAADVEDKRKAGREGGRPGGRAGDVEDKRKAGREGGESSGLTRSAAARRLHGHDDDAFSRRPAYQAMHLFVIVSIGRKV